MRPVAIVARGGTHSLAPFRDSNWEIWGMPWCRYPRLDRAFEIHAASFFETKADTWFTGRKWEARFRKDHPGVEVWCDPSRMDAFENPVSFPLEEVKRGLAIPYLENSIAYMVALALHEGRTEIGLYGVHLFAGPEAELSLGSVAYLVGVANGRGIKITIPPGSPLFMSNYTAGRYGVRDSRRHKFPCFAGVQNYE